MTGLLAALVPSDFSATPWITDFIGALP